MSEVAVIRIDPTLSPSGASEDRTSATNSLSKRLLSTWRRNWRFKQQNGITVVHVGTISGPAISQRSPLDQSGMDFGEKSGSEASEKGSVVDPNNYRTVLHIRSDSGEDSSPQNRTVIAVSPNLEFSQRAASPHQIQVQNQQAQGQSQPINSSSPSRDSATGIPEITLDNPMSSRQNTRLPPTSCQDIPPKAGPSGALGSGPPLPAQNHIGSRFCRAFDRQSNLPFLHQNDYINASRCRSLRVTSSSAGCCKSVTALRWFVFTLSMLGLSCVLIGILLGALTVTGNARLTICLLMIGVGIVLITVSAVAWRLTSLDPRQPITCRALLGLQPSRDRSSGTHPLFAAQPPGGNDNFYLQPPPPNIPPEFIWRPPPPSYHASTQEQMLRNFLEAQALEHRRRAGSPPPTYRSFPSPPSTLATSRTAQVTIHGNDFREGQQGSQTSSSHDIENIHIRVSATSISSESSTTGVANSSAPAAVGSNSGCRDHNLPSQTASARASESSDRQTPGQVSSTESPQAHPLNTSHISVVDCSASTPRGFRVDRDLPPPYPCPPRPPFIFIPPPRMAPGRHHPRPMMPRPPVYTVTSAYSSYV